MRAIPIMAAMVATAAACAAGPAGAADLFGGVYRHDVDLFTRTIHEGGSDVEVGYRFDPIAGLGPIGGPAPYVFASVNTTGDTDFVAGGLSWTFGGPVYVRPGIGVAVHDGPRRRYVGDERVDLGSRVLFEPELAIGWRVAPRVAIEASYTHLSHAQIFGNQNPGLDMLGVRLNLHLP